ncbi:Cleavage polyadenylation factor subunit clp1 [Ophidiomyces ophidiicola]|nr:Cleavage polyadenylation factor subunit clp1 [Ophidiomyces ophidiicola]KAI1989655.1 Cleavage polyadenylation factor subunit clp1 [Ophidiomyces ophidiicola]KAI1991446.1 Cleavage polyadenylation factor subunit clp1 [Ophidiomyces ophidiicola]KAI2003597.1 Cleavage polyadenylation factor subunit clp1 [Ophidiomyces ophidiicola]
MSLPGLELSQQTIEAQRAPPPPTQITLTKGSEWRFEVAFGNTTRVKLLAGTAELFGTELATSQTYTFSGTKAAVYTWHGCTLEVTTGDPVALGPIGSAPIPPGPGNGGCQVEYTAEETPMAEYANVHFALETMRQEAKAAGRDGPRVLILGPEDAGKTSLTKILTGYATKMGGQPLVVNLDPSEGMLSVPGALTATAFRSMVDIEEGWGSSPMSGPSPIPVKLPLVYFYGLPSPLDGDGSYYKAIISRLALAVTGRVSEDQETRETGVIIDTPGIVGQGKGVSEDIIHHIVTEFSISTILVIGSERLYSSMVKNYDNKPIATSATAVASDERISVVKLTKSGGCVDRDAVFMKYVRESQIRSYFFGNLVPSTASSALSLSSTTTGTTISLSPHTSQADFETLAIYNINIATDGEEDEYDPLKYSLNESFLPGGGNESDTKTPATSLQPLSSLIPGLGTDYGHNSSNGSAANISAPFKRLPSPAPLSLENTLLAITHAASNASLEEIRDSSVMGFIYVADVDDKKGQGGKLRLLAPVGGRVPNRAAIWGRKWPGELVGLVG